MKILTWNISLADPSFQAPSDWDRNLNIFEIHKIIEEEDPDIFTLQEIPSVNFGMRFVNYQYVEPVSSHSGLVGIFVKHKYIIHRVISISPSVAVEISERVPDKGMSNPRFFFAAAHLFPYKQNMKIRLDQMSDLMDKMENPSSEYPIIIAGDVNMRENETEKMMSVFNLNDAFLETDQSKEVKYTWDSRINLFHEEGFQFACRFDRIFLRRARIINFKLIGNEPASEISNHYLSDHFGISAELTFDEL